MKKLFLSSALFVFLLTAAPVAYVHAANTEDTAALNFGVCGGLNRAVTRLRSTDEITEAISPKLLGLHGGIWGEYALDNTVGIRLALSYDRKGTMCKEGNLKKMYTKFNYLVLSPTLRIYPGSSRAFGIFVGPYIGYLRTASQQENDGESTDLFSESTEEQPKRIDAGITFGLECEHSSGIILGCSMHAGLKSSIKCEEQDSQLNMYNTVQQIYLGYNFAKPLHAANTEDTAALNFGVCGGLNRAVTRLRSTDEITEAISPKLLGLHGGIWGEYALDNTVGIRLALSYDRKGTMCKEGNLKKMYTKFNYLVLSPTLRIYPGSSRAFGIFVGPYIGYLRTASQQENDGESTDLFSESTEEQPKRIDAGITFGLECEHSSGIILGCSMHAGLKSSIKCEEQDSQLNMYNTVQQIYLGYNFAKLLN